MHELRKDPLLNRWVTVLDYSLGPKDYIKKFTKRAEETGPCKFCEGREAETPPEIVALRKENTPPNGTGWHARVIPNPRPILRIEGSLDRQGVGIYDRMNSIGANELILESPEHEKRAEDYGPEQVKRILMLYQMRLSDLEKDPRMRYVFICKNSGRGSGALYSHPHSEITAMPIIPKLLKDELDSAKQYYAYKERCIFCDIINEELRTGQRIITITSHFIAFCPYAPKMPFEFWIIPRRHHCAFQDMRSDEVEDLSLLLTDMLKKLRTLLEEPPFHYVLHTAPNRIPRRDHWHTLGDDYHWHIEFTPRLVRASGVEWGSEFYVLTTSPEDAAKYLKEA